MHENKPVQGIVHQINYRISESINTAYEHKNIFNKLKFLLSSKDVMVALSYELDMVRSDGTFISCPHYRQESEIFKTKEELISSLYYDTWKF